MTKTQLLASIISDLGANYKAEDETLLTELLDEVTNNALRFSNRRLKTNVDDQIEILAPEIRRCTKSLYLQRGSEDVSSQNQSGLNSKYTNALERMRQDIYKGGKRILF